MAGYGTTDGLRAYAEAAGLILPAGATDAQIAAARQRGALAVDRYEPRFPGRRSGGFDQERAWPRTEATTRAGDAIPADVIPVAIVSASYEAAVLELSSPGSLLPVVTGASVVKREKVDVIDVEYAVGSAENAVDLAALATPIVTTIEALLTPFFRAAFPDILVV